MTRRVPRRYVQHAKKDGNHSEIVATLQALGVEPVDTTAVGGGFPDLVLPICGLTVLAEIKLPEGSLEPSQTRFHAEWRGGPIAVLRSASDAVTLVTTIRNVAARGRKVLG